MRRPLRLLALLTALSVGLAAPAAEGQRRPRESRGGGGADSQINESSPDELAGPPAAETPKDLPGRLREFVSGSAAKYEAMKSGAAGFRRLGWYPSFFLRDPAQDVVVEAGAGPAKTVTVHLAYARRDVEQRLVVAPAEAFALPGADRRFLAELLAALATAAPEIAHARIRFWFAALLADGHMTWEDRGTLGLAASVARRFPPGARTVEALWPLLDENTLPAGLWPK